MLSDDKQEIVREAIEKMLSSDDPEDIKFFARSVAKHGNPNINALFQDLKSRVSFFKSLGYSQRDIARASGVSQREVTKILNGERPSNMLLITMCSQLNPKKLKESIQCL